jgi:hypothetical protein
MKLVRKRKPDCAALQAQWSLQNRDRINGHRSVSIL